MHATTLTALGGEGAGVPEDGVAARRGEGSLAETGRARGGLAWTATTGGGLAETGVVVVAVLLQEGMPGTEGKDSTTTTW